MKLIGKTLFVAVIISLVFSIPFAIAKEKQIRFALVSQSATWPWAVQYVDGVKSMARELGVKVTITDAGWDPAKQVDQLAATIKGKPDAIIIQHGQTEPLANLVGVAAKQGIPVLNTCLIMPKNTVCEIDQNDKAFMHDAFTKMAEDLGGKGKIALIWVGGFAPMERRKAQLKLELEKYPGIKIVSEFGSAGASVVADNMAKMEAVIKAHPDLDAVLACWDQFAVAAFKAVKASGKNIPIYSIDVDAQDISMMRAANSPWKFTVATDSRELGRIAVRFAMKAIRGEEVPRRYLGPVTPIAQKTLREMPKKQLMPTKKYFPNWGESGVGWTPWMRELVKKNKK